MRDCAPEAEVERRTDGENRVRSPPREAIAPGRRGTPPGIAVHQSLARATVSHDLSYRNPPVLVRRGILYPPVSGTSQAHLPEVGPWAEADRCGG